MKQPECSQKNKVVWKKPRAKRGRKRTKRTFEETRVGYFLKHEAPLEYSLLLNVTDKNFAPSSHLIESIGYASLNPLFRKAKFRRSLIEYRKTGLYSGRPRKANIESEAYYLKLRRKAKNKR